MTARDKIVDAVLADAAGQMATHSKGAILVRRANIVGAKGPPFERPPTRNETRVKPAAPTAMELALVEAGIAQRVTRKDPVPTKAQRVDPKSPPKQSVPRDQPEVSDRRVNKVKKPKPMPKPKRVNFTRKVRGKKAPSKPVMVRSTEIERAERMKGRLLKAKHTISRIDEITPDELLHLWHEHITTMQNKQSAFRQLSADYIEAIEGEWKRRAILARLDPDHFEWPSTMASPGSGNFGSLAYTEGMLAYLSYHVGKTGEASAARRQSLLARVFEGPLPPINGPDYMKEWSLPDSPGRLRKMAECLASAVKSAKRRGHADYSVAIEHWEEDLAFLYRKYYVNKFGFDWPSKDTSE